MLRLFSALGLSLLASAVSAQSLGDAAAKEQRRREGLRQVATPAPRVITELELANGKGRVANEPTEAAPAAEPVPPSGVPRATAPLGGVLLADDRTIPVTSPVAPVRPEEREAHWRQEAERRRAALAMAEQAVGRTGRWSDPTYAGTDRPWCPITARNMQATAVADLARARKSLDALEDDARRGGALPGWIR